MKRSLVFLSLLMLCTSCRISSSNTDQIKIKVIRDPSQKFVHMSLYYPVPEAPKNENAGIGSLLLNMLVNGDNNAYSSAETKKMLSEHQAQVDYGCTNDYGMISITFPMVHISQVAPLFKQMIFKNKLSEQSFQASKKDLISKLGQSTEYEKIMDQVNKDYFGSHPYSIEPSGTPESLNLIRLDSMKEYYKKNIGQGKLTLVVTGDITESMMEKYFGKSTSAKGFTSDYITQSYNPENIEPAFFPNKQRSVLVYSNIYIRNEEEAVALNILKELIKKRITERIRVKDGLAYIIDVSIGVGQLYTFSIRVVSDDLILVVTHLKEELELLRSDPDTYAQKDVQDSMRTLLTQFYLQLEDPGHLVGFVGEGQVFGFDTDRLLNHFNGQIVYDPHRYKETMDELLFHMKYYITGSKDNAEKSKLTGILRSGYGK